MEEVSAGGELAAVEEVAEADGAGLVGRRGGLAEEAVETAHEFVVVAVLGEGRDEGLEGAEAGVEDGEDPQVVEQPHLEEQEFEEDLDEVVVVPDAHRTACDLLNEFQFVGGLDFVDVLVEVAQQVVADRPAAHPQAPRVHHQHHRRENQ